MINLIVVVIAICYTQPTQHGAHVYLNQKYRILFDHILYGKLKSNFEVFRKTRRSNGFTNTFAFTKV